jgi:two-component system sensor histidine kinase PhcS
MQLLSAILSFGSSATKRPEGLSPFAWRMMQSEERKMTLKNQRLITLLIVTLVPLFSILDYFAYPELFGLFFILRMFCVAATVVTYSLMRTSLGKSYYRAFTVFLPLIPAFFISLMVLFSRDPGTSYYAGLTLCIVAIGFVFHWTYLEAFSAVVSIGMMYFIASAPAILDGMDSRTAAGFVNNCIFIMAKGLVIVLGCYAHHGFRVKSFIIRDRSRRQSIALQQQKVEIESTLQELKETEDELIQSEKMASLGQLSAGVIHEIGNPLNYSNQALFMLRRLLKKEEDNELVQEAMDDIQDSIERMKDIVSELREFSHKSGEDRLVYPASESVDLALKMLGKDISDGNVAVSDDVDPGLKIQGVKNQVTQVFINLIHNAVQAASKSEDKDSKLIRVSSRETPDSVVLTVWDNGPGIDEEVRRHIFDPFFTTKDAGEGTGLGLSICFRIVDAHNGNLSVDSVPGEYTQFTIELPKPGTSRNRSTHKAPIPKSQTHHEHAVS